MWDGSESLLEKLKAAKDVLLGVDVEWCAVGFSKGHQRSSVAMERAALIEKWAWVLDGRAPRADRFYDDTAGRVKEA